MSDITIAQLTEKIRFLEEENKRLRMVIQEQNLTILRLRGNNPRNAGRKSADEKWISGFAEFISMKQAGASREKIMESLGISRATFYRYQKLFNETSGV